ncbi:MAG: transposase [Acidimicrobiales bacterium]
MIASDQSALRVGSAKLIVDGTDTMLVRKAEISLRPSRVRARALSQLLHFSRDIYNGALQHRRDAWHITRNASAPTSISRFDQFNQVKELKEVCPAIGRFGITPVRGAISRVDEAFGAFFRRVKNGEAPGYPRFKSAARFATIFYDSPTGWHLRGVTPGPPRKDGRPAQAVAAALYVQGVGEIPLGQGALRQLRRLLARGGEPRTLTITRTRSGAWRGCVGFRAVALRPLPEAGAIGGVDRGIWVTAALPDGTLLRCPAFLKEARAQIAELQRQREQFEKFSTEWKKINKAVAKTYAQAHRRAENWARHAAIDIVARYGVIALEDLQLVNMSKSAKGTKESPGRGVAQKKGLNRSLQDAALARLAYWICVKAEEAGRRVWKVNAKDSSRECIACGHTEAANRSRARFSCTRCRHEAHADVNAAQVVTARGQVAETSWRAAGRPVAKRPEPKNRRRQAAEPSRSTGPGRLLTQQSREPAT